MAPLLPVDEALERLLNGIAPCPAERVNLHEAAGRVLAGDVASLRSHPPFDASAMDGYAVRAEDIAKLPAELTVIGEAAAGGRFKGTVSSGEAVRIFTGAPVPKGADTILLQEDADRIGDNRIAARESTAVGRHIRFAGLDFSEGDILLRQGRVLDPAALSLAAAANHPELDVVARTRVAILATGDELVAPGGKVGPNQIVASNSYGIAAIIGQAGGIVLDLGIVPDDKPKLADAVEQALSSQIDVLVTLGGVSVGEHDHVQDVLTGLGMELDFWKIAMRPGKPLMVGRFGDTRVLGLPGNPVSAMVCAHLFLVPLLARRSGRPHAPDMRDAVLASPMKPNEARQDYVRAYAEVVNGKLVARPFEVQDSSMLSVLAAANCLIVRGPFAKADNVGAPCRVLMLR